MFFNSLIRIGFVCLFIVGGAHSASASSKDHGHLHKGYYKPGAAIALTSDYDGTTQPGELENLTLKLTHHYSSGYISARLLETPDLHIMSHGALENEKIQTGSNLSLPIQFSGSQDGEYYIGLEVIYESLSGNRSLRVVSLPIHIGRASTSKTTKASSKKLKSSRGKGLVILNAQETIK